MKPRDIGLFVQYALLNFGYWIDNLIVFSFAAVLLSGRGFTPAQIGYVTTLAALLTIVLQLSMSTLADRSTKITLKQIMAAMIAAAVVTAAATALMPGIYVASFVGMFTSMALVSALSPLITSLCLQYNAAGHNIDYGLARSVGSLGYALAGYVMGRITEEFGSEITLPIFCGLHALLLALVCLMRRPQPVEHIVDASHEASSLREFFRCYRRFDLYLLTAILLNSTQFIHNTYLIYFVRHYGGDAADMGLLLSVCAFAEMPAIAVGVRLIKRFSAETLLRISAVSGPIKFAAMLIIPNIHWFIGLQVIQFTYAGLFTVSSVYFVSSLVRQKDSIKAQSLIAVGLGGICSIAANFSGGWMLERFSIQTILVIGTGVVS